MKLIADHSRVYIEGAYPKHLIEPVTSYLVKGYYFAPSYRKGTWDGRKRFIEYDRKRSQYYFATGFLNNVVDALEKAQYRYELEDTRDYDPKEAVYTLEPNLVLNEGKYSYQGDAIDAALTHGRGIIKAATGAGKSEIGAAIIKSINEKTTWFTHRANLLNQTRERLQKRLGVEVGIAGDDQCEICNVTVCMIQTAQNRLRTGNNPLAEHLENSKLIIGDEIHHLISNQWYSVLEQMKAPWRYGLSATPNLNGEGLALLAQTGHIIFEISAKELIERGVLVPPRIWFYTVESQKVIEKNYQQVYSKAIVNNPTRNQAICNIAHAFKREGKSTLVLVKRISHGEMLADQLNFAGCRTKFMCGKNSSQERDEMLKALTAGELDTIVAMTEIMAEGVDIPDLRAVINATGSSGGGDATKDDESGRVTIQMLGRGLRSSPGKTYMEFVDFIDKQHKFVRDASKDRISTLESLGFSDYIKYYHERISEG